MYCVSVSTGEKCFHNQATFKHNGSRPGVKGEAAKMKKCSNALLIFAQTVFHIQTHIVCTINKQFITSCILVYQIVSTCLKQVVKDFLFSFTFSKFRTLPLLYYGGQKSHLLLTLVTFHFERPIILRHNGLLMFKPSVSQSFELIILYKRDRMLLSVECFSL